MTFTRIRSYYTDGKWTGCEQIYARDQYNSIEWFKKDYPAHNSCIIVAEDYDPEEDPDHFRVCSECGCVHYWK